MLTRESKDDSPADPDLVEGRDMTYEEHLVARRRRWLRVYLPILAVLVLLAAFGGKPVWRAIKAFQARRIAAEASSLMAGEKWQEASRRAMDAYQLSFMEPEAIRVNGQIRARGGRAGESLHFWRELEKLGKLTVDDRRDFASSSLAAGDLETAARQVEEINNSGAPSKAGDFLLNAQIAAGKAEYPRALEAATKVVTADSGAADRERYLAAMLLINLPNAEARKLGSRQVTALTSGNGAVALEALVYEARRTRTGGVMDGLAPSEIVRALEAHPLSSPVHRLLALDVRARQDPLRREEFIQQAIREFGSPENKDALAKLVVWLNEKKEFERVLQLVTFERSIASTELFLGRLDALGALNRWQEVRQVLDSQKFPLDPIIQELYLARALAQLGDKTGSDNRWLKARQAATGSIEKLLLVARYADKAGNVVAAEAAYRQAAEAAPEVRPLQETFLRFLSDNAETVKVHRQVRAMLRLWPQDPSLQNDDAYLSALRNEGLEAALATAEGLVAATPTSMPHRTTLALARLRLSRNADALAVFRNINVPDAAALPNTRLIYALALRACGFGTEAVAEAQKIPRERLRAEERVLLDQISR